MLAAHNSGETALLLGVAPYRLADGERAVPDSTRSSAPVKLSRPPEKSTMLSCSG